MTKRLEITYPQDVPYILICVHETVTMPVVSEMIAEIKNVLKETSIRSFLIDVRSVRADVTPIENYEVAYKDVKQAYDDINQRDLSHEVKLALVSSPGDNSHDFAETVGRNAGSNITLFKDYDAAVSWLSDSE